MRKYLSLTKVLLKSGFGVNDAKSKKWFKCFIYIVLAVSFLPILALLYVMIDAMLPLYARIDQMALPMGLMLFLTCFVIFIFSLFAIPSIFYFSSDIDVLLGLPLSGEQIISAKFTVCLIYEYLFSCGVMIPTYAAYLHYGGMPVTFLLYAIPIILILPVFPLVLSTFFTILLMRFVPFFKNRDRFNLISGILLVVLGMGFSLYINTLGAQSETQLLNHLLSGNNSLLDLFMKLFPMIPYYSKALTNGSIIDFLIGTGICLIALCIFLTLGKFLYFKGVIGSGETSAAHKMIDSKQLTKATRQGNKIWTYMKKDMKIILRTPAFFTNCVCTAIIFPLLVLLIPVMNNTGGENEFDLIAMILYVEDMPNFPAYVIFVALGAGLMIGTINFISATAISREGSQYFVMKVLPMSYRDQIHAKTLCGILVGLFANLAMSVALAIVLPFSWYYYVLYFIVTMIPTVLGNELGILIDLTKPKLIWEQEVSAVKQNLGAFVSMMSGMALCILIIAAAFFLPADYIMVAAAAACIIAVLASWGAYVLVGAYAEKAMRKL